MGWLVSQRNSLGGSVTQAIIEGDRIEWDTGHRKIQGTVWEFRETELVVVEDDDGRSFHQREWRLDRFAMPIITIVQRCEGKLKAEIYRLRSALTELRMTVDEENRGIIDKILSEK